MRLSAVVITLNEEKNLADCLAGLRFCDEIVVVDSGSHDRTVEIAERAGARVLKRLFTNFASQKNHGIDAASGDWVLSVDADERVSPELAAEIRGRIETPCADAYFLKRRNRILGRWMKYGANKGDHQLRLVRRGRARFEGRVHERLRPEGKAAVLKNPLLHLSTPDVSAYLRKLNLYADLEAEQMTGRPDSVADMLFRPAAVFFYRAFLQGGLADGREGFVFCVLSAYYEFVRRMKRWEKSGHR